MSDDFTTSAGPYVLGALSPAERERFVAHLDTCPACQAAVEDLAGLPGLLARVPVGVVTAMDEDSAARSPGPVPDTLLPSLLRAVARRRVRRRWGLGALAAVAAGAVVALVVTLTSPGAPGPPTAGTDPGAPSAPRVMQVLVDAPVTATAGLDGVAWGTRVDLRCTYTPHGSSGPSTTPSPPPSAGPGEGDEGAVAYELVVTDRRGSSQVIGTWKPLPGKEVTVVGASSVPRQDIATVEVRTSSGTTVLRLDATGAA